MASGNFTIENARLSKIARSSWVVWSHKSAWFWYRKSIGQVAARRQDIQSRSSGRVNDAVSRVHLKVASQTKQEGTHSHGFLVDFFSVQAMPEPGAHRSSAYKALRPPLLSIHIGTTGPVVVQKNHKKQKASIDKCSQTSGCPIDPRVACHSTLHRICCRRPQP